MQAKLLALFVASAAAVAVPSDSGSYIDEEHGIEWLSGVEERSVKNALFERTVCNADNCLRNLRDARYSSSASVFCSTWIQSTVTNTQYAIQTDHQTVTQTPAPVIITDVVVQDKTVPTATQTVTQYTTKHDPRYKREGNVAAYPPWLSASYPASRVSSACSCFIATPSPAIQQTVTLTTATDVVVDTQTLPPVTNTVTQTSTHTVNNVATQTVTVGLNCGLKGCVRGGSDIISQFYASNIATCKSACTANPNCKAFDYSSFFNWCLLAKTDASSWWTSSICLTFKVFDRQCQV